MAKADLRIALERPDRTYKATEKIKGAVEVNVRDDCQCKGLSLFPGWQTAGKGNKDSGEQEPQVLYTGPWQAGQIASYPFEIDAPLEPLTYSGKLFSIQWFLRARADIPTAIDPKTEESFILIPGTLRHATDSEAEEDEEEAAEISKSVEFSIPPAVGLVVAIAFFLLGVFLFWHLYGIFQRGVPWKESHMWVVFGAIGSLLFGGGGIWHSTRHLMLASKLGPVEVQINSSNLRPGDALTCTIRFRPAGEIDLTEATLQLRAKEHVVKGSGKNRRTISETVHEQSITVTSDRRLMAGEGVVLEGKLQIPADAPYSVFFRSNWLDWKLSAQLNLRRLPDWKKDIPLSVSPYV